MATWNAGERIVADKLSKYADEPEVRETNSSAYTAETVLDTTTVPVVNGRRYRIIWDSEISSSVNSTAETDRVRIREDNITGTVLQTRTITLPNAVAAPAHVEARFTATSTGNKTFVVTGSRLGGTGSHISGGNSSAPTILAVEND
jgi:hypothetical protein